jgi:cell division transport system permease protein
MNRRLANRSKPAVHAAGGGGTPRSRSRSALRAWREQHRYSLVASLRHVAARPWASALTLAVLGLALALPWLFWLLLDNVRQLGSGREDPAVINVFLKPALPPAEIPPLLARLRARKDVAAVDLRTPEEALDEFRSRVDIDDALRVLHYNPLPAVLLVRPGVAALAEETALVEALRREPQVDLVQYDPLWRRRLAAILALAERAAEVLAVLLAAAALLVIGNTVRLDIQGRSEEIAVLQLLGADEDFVRRPFLYTGLCYGTFAGALCAIMVGIVEWVLAAPLQQLAASYAGSITFHGLPLSGMFGMLVGGAALGWLGAWLAANRHIALGLPR